MTSRREPVVHGVAVRPRPGEHRCGDRAVVAPCGGATLLAVVDGLGHGPEAAAAADAAAAVLERHAGDPPAALLHRCHDALRHTRGAAVSLASLDASGRLQWAGVGNVHGVVVPRRDRHVRLVCRGGIVGLRLPSLRPTDRSLSPGDLLVVFTDGVADELVDDLTARGDPQPLADRLLAQHAHGHDDALVLVARYEGTSSERAGP